jgi:hypothetical protein
MRVESSRRLRGLAVGSALVLGACSPAAPTAAQAVTDWDCPAIACETLEPSAVCSAGVCVTDASDANVRALVRLPTNTSVAPGMIFLTEPASAADCSGCVSSPTAYTTEQGILLAREAARALGFAASAEIVVPARVTLEPLVEGAFAMNAVLPRPLGLTTLERWARDPSSTPWRAPGGGAPETSRAVLFEGRYARRIDPEPPFDAQVPPVLDTLALPGGAQLYVVAPGQLTSVAIERLVLPFRDAGWSVFLVDAKGDRRSSRARMDAHDGPLALRIDAAQTPDPLLLDLVVAPNDASLAAPRLVVPAPTALRRIAYPAFAGTSRVNVRVVDAAGKPAAGAYVSFALNELEPVPGSEGELFASYARAEAGVTTNASGLATLQVPFGSYDAFARASIDGTLRGTRSLTYSFGSETASATFRPTAPRALTGTCAFVGGKSLAGAEIEARALDERSVPRGVARAFVTTDASGAFRFELPEGAFAFWLHPPAGAPMADQYLGRDASDAARLSQLDCRLRAPARRTLTILDGPPQVGAPVSSALVETLRLRPGAAPLWLGEGIARPDGRVVLYEAP